MANEWKPHVVQQGEHVRKLAFRCGSTPDEVWGHAKNAELKEKRTSFDQLAPGDVIHLPADRAVGLALQQGSSNRYRATVEKVSLDLVLQATGRTFANEPFEVHGTGAAQPLPGTTDGAGCAHFEVPVWVREVLVKLTARGHEFPILIGDLDPVEEDSGVAQRLRQLGYLTHDGDEEALIEATSRFQCAQGMKPTGEIDQATRDALAAQHRS